MDKIECQIIEDCPDFMYGSCQKYLDGDCSAHKCDLKIIIELQQKLKKIKEIATCCNENMLCPDCKWDYMCGGELNDLILQIIEDKENVLF